MPTVSSAQRHKFNTKNNTNTQEQKENNVVGKAVQKGTREKALRPDKYIYKKSRNSAQIIFNLYAPELFFFNFSTLCI